MSTSRHSVKSAEPKPGWWAQTGQLLYWLSWPALCIYFRFHSQRTRVIIRSGNDVLLVKDWLGDGSWKLPGGGLHKGELPVQGAARELAEETAINIDPQKLLRLGTLSTSLRGMPVKNHIFYYQLAKPAKLRRQKGEILIAAWQPSKEFTMGNKLTIDTRQIVDRWPELF